MLPPFFIMDAAALFWAVDPKGTMSYRTEGGIFVHWGRGSLRGDRAWQGGEWLEAWNKEVGAWGGSGRTFGRPEIPPVLWDIVPFGSADRF